MRKSKLAFLAILIFSLALFLSGCGPTSQEPSASFSANPTSGNAPLEVNFDASGSSDSDGNITSYEWDFDDETTGSGETVTHTFDSSGTYDVELTVTDNDDATDSIHHSETISVYKPNQPPTTSFTANPKSGESPLEVTFDASGSKDPDGNINTYDWDFGDGSTDSGETVNHTYSSSGSYTAQLTVEDDEGATDSATVNISVSAPSNESPNASFSANPTSGEAPLGVSFDASDSNDPDGSIASYEWDFGDGSSGTGITIDHTFENPDDPIDSTFDVELIVTDNDGASSTATETITVSSPENQPLNASFTATPNSGEAVLKVEFDASGSSDSDGTINQYNWSFGAFGETVTHTFNTAGDYKVTLEVRDDDLATDSTTKTISVSAPNYNFLAIGEPYEAPDGLTVTLNSLDVTEKIGSYEYSINYTLENNTEDQKIAEGTFKMYYKNKTGGEPQYGFFDELFPGDSVTRTYTFEELKSDPCGILEYHHDHYFSEKPLSDSLKWKVTLP